MYTTNDQVGRTLNYQVKVAAAILSSRLNELIFTVHKVNPLKFTP